jgi:hypothetical protein
MLRRPVESSRIGAVLVPKDSLSHKETHVDRRLEEGLAGRRLNNLKYTAKTFGILVIRTDSLESTGDKKQWLGVSERNLTRPAGKVI